MYIFFLDENLHGDKFATVLRDAGIAIELYKAHYPPGVDDTIWIPEVANRDWISLTGDVRTRFKPWEKAVIVRSNARMVHVKKGKNATHKMLATNFVNTFDAICRFLDTHSAPCLATLTRPSKIQDYFAGKPGGVNIQKL